MFDSPANMKQNASKKNHWDSLPPHTLHIKTSRFHYVWIPAARALNSTNKCYFQTAWCSRGKLGIHPTHSSHAWWGSKSLKCKVPWRFRKLNMAYCTTYCGSPQHNIMSLGSAISEPNLHSVDSTLYSVTCCGGLPLSAHVKKSGGNCSK